MRIFTIIVRVLVGLLLLFASITYFFHLAPVPEAQGDVKKYNDGLAASVYLMPLVKTIELLCGLSFVTGFYVPFFAILILPVSINAFLFHLFLAPEAIGGAAFLLLGNIYLLYVNRSHYSAVFKR